MEFKRIKDTWITFNLLSLIAIFSKVDSLSLSTVADKLLCINPWPPKSLCYRQLQQTIMPTCLCQDRRQLNAFIIHAVIRKYIRVRVVNSRNKLWLYDIRQRYCPKWIILNIYNSLVLFIHFWMSFESVKIFTLHGNGIKLGAALATWEHTHTHTHTHTHKCWFLWFTGTFHRRNGFYTVQAVCAIALHLPYT